METSTIATNSGDLTKPPAFRPETEDDRDREGDGEADRGQPEDPPSQPLDVELQTGEEQEEASPTRARIDTGRSGWTQPRPDGPITMPSTISSTIEGSRMRGKNPSARGARNPAATTISRFER